MIWTRPWCNVSSSNTRPADPPPGQARGLGWGWIVPPRIKVPEVREPNRSIASRPTSCWWVIARSARPVDRKLITQRSRVEICCLKPAM